MMNISHLKVDELHEGRGLGTLLIHAAEAHATQRGWHIEETKLHVHRENKRARGCYSKNQFVADEATAQGTWTRMTSRRTT